MREELGSGVLYDVLTLNHGPSVSSDEVRGDPEVIRAYLGEAH
jgi:hypothetical protein